MQTVCSTYRKAGKGNLTAQNARKPFGGRGSAPDPAGEITTLPQTWWEGLAARSLRTLHPLSALQASPLLPHSKISSDAVADTQK